MSEDQLQLELTSAREQIASLATERDRLAGELADERSHGDAVEETARTLNRELVAERERDKAAAEVDHERITQLEAALVAIRPFVGQDQNMDSRDVELCSAAERLVDAALAAPVAQEASGREGPKP